MALNDNALITWAQFKDALEIVENNKQSIYEWLINGASNRVEKMIGRSLISTERTEYHAGHGDDQIMLNIFPVTEVDSVNLDGSREFESDTVVDSDDYEVDEKNGVIYLFDDLTTQGRKTVKVVYTAGYETIPEDLQSAVAEIVVANYRRMSKNQAGIKSIAAPDSIGTTYELAIPVNALRTIDLYREERV